MAKKDERSASEKAFHQREIARLYKRKGKTQQEIADELKISQATVSRDLVEIRRRWAKETIKDASVIIADELSELDQIRLASWDMLERNPDNERLLTVLIKNVLAQHSVRGLDKIQVQELPPEDMSKLPDEELASIAAGKAAGSRRP